MVTLKNAQEPPNEAIRRLGGAQVSLTRVKKRHFGQPAGREKERRRGGENERRREEERRRGREEERRRGGEEERRRAEEEQMR